MNKLNANQTKTYLSQMKNVNAVSFDELITDANQQQSKARVRQVVHQLIDAASSGKKRLLVSIGD